MCQSDVNIKPATVSSPSQFEILIPQVEKPGEGTRDFAESSVQFVQVAIFLISYDVVYNFKLFDSDQSPH